MLIDAWATTQKIQEDTGMTVDQILALPADEYARLSGRHTPAVAEVRRLYAAKDKTVAEIGTLFDITRESVYRYVRAGQDDEQAAAKPRKRTVQTRAS